MVVVGGGIVVLDLDSLACHNAHYMWVVLATALVERDCIFGHVKSAAPYAVLYIDEDIGQIAAIDHDSLGFVRALATRVLTHIDLGGLWSRSIKLHRTVNCGSCCWIYWGGGAGGDC